MPTQSDLLEDLEYEPHPDVARVEGAIAERLRQARLRFQDSPATAELLELLEMHHALLLLSREDLLRQALAEGAGIDLTPFAERLRAVAEALLDEGSLTLEEAADDLERGMRLGALHAEMLEVAEELEALGGEAEEEPELPLAFRPRLDLD